MHVVYRYHTTRYQVCDKKNSVNVDRSPYIGHMCEGHSRTAAEKYTGMDHYRLLSGGFQYDLTYLIV